MSGQAARRRQTGVVGHARLAETDGAADATAGRRPGMMAGVCIGACWVLRGLAGQGARGVKNRWWWARARMAYRDPSGAGRRVCEAQAGRAAPLSLGGSSAGIHQGSVLAQPLEPLEQARFDDRLRNAQHVGRLGPR